MTHLHRLHAAGVTINLSPSGELQAHRRGGLTPDQADYIRRHQASIVDLLRTHTRGFRVLAPADLTRLVVLLPRPGPLAEAQAQARRLFRRPLALEPILFRRRTPAAAVPITTSTPRAA